LRRLRDRARDRAGGDGRGRKRLHEYPRRHVEEPVLIVFESMRRGPAGAAGRVLCSAKLSAQSRVLLDAARVGALIHGRISGVLAGLKEALRDAMATCRVVTIDGDGQFTLSLERVRRHLARSAGGRVPVGAMNDSSALGAVRAFQEAGRAADCAVVGQNAEPDARAELRAGHTPLIGSVAYFPERYGEELIALALDILAHRPTPPARFVKHQVITAANLAHFYPNDALLESPAV
jgi:ribose transport system substrate-binding protein